MRDFIGPGEPLRGRDDSRAPFPVRDSDALAVWLPPDG
jgi:hypothetical protein